MLDCYTLGDGEYVQVLPHLDFDAPALDFSFKCEQALHYNDLIKLLRRRLRSGTQTKSIPRLAQVTELFADVDEVGLVSLYMSHFM